jgi:hypothetical protein
MPRARGTLALHRPRKRVTSSRAASLATVIPKPLRDRGIARLGKGLDQWRRVDENWILEAHSLPVRTLALATAEPPVGFT